MTILQCGQRQLDLSQPVVMGILNVTPDSFSDGGQFMTLPAALTQARRMYAEGARMIDIGAESTRPGATLVSVQEELDRIGPVVEAIHAELDVVISVDTSTPEVIRAMAAAGAGFINDVRALRCEGALAAAYETGLPVCLMHMQGRPDTMQQQPYYDDVLREVDAFFRERIAACLVAGIAHENIVLDPGLGFGKTLAHNLALLDGLAYFEALGCPQLIGLSRKAMLGAILEGRAVDQRLFAGVAATAIAVLNGARIVRTHDVKATCDAVAVSAALLAQRAASACMSPIQA
jgi:dihydropteroate synthase